MTISSQLFYAKQSFISNLHGIINKMFNYTHLSDYYYSSTNIWLSNYGQAENWLQIGKRYILLTTNITEKYIANEPKIIKDKNKKISYSKTITLFHNVISFEKWKVFSDIIIVMNRKKRGSKKTKNKFSW